MQKECKPFGGKNSKNEKKMKRGKADNRINADFIPFILSTYCSHRGREISPEPPYADGQMSDLCTGVI